MKQIKSIALIKTNDGRLTVFNSALEKEQFKATHTDAIIDGNHAIEPLYMLVDTEGTGFCLTPKHAVTYNEAIYIIKMYY